MDGCLHPVSQTQSALLSQSFTMLCCLAATSRYSAGSALFIICPHSFGGSRGHSLCLAPCCVPSAWYRARHRAPHTVGTQHTHAERRKEGNEEGRRTDEGEREARGGPRRQQGGVAGARVPLEASPSPHNRFSIFSWLLSLEFSFFLKI